MRIFSASTCSGVTTPPTPPKWSLWLCEKITALIGRLPDFASTVSANSFHPAAALSSARSGRSEEHTSELQSLMRLSYAVFCLKTNNHTHKRTAHYPSNTQWQTS